MSPVLPSAKVQTVAPWVSRYSRVRGISRKLLHPLLITATAVRPSLHECVNMVLWNTGPMHIAGAGASRNGLNHPFPEWYAFKVRKYDLLSQIGGDIQTILSTTMNSSQPACPKDLDACSRSKNHGARYRGAA